MRLIAADTAFVLVDVQDRLLPHIHEAEELVRFLAVLLQGLSVLSVPGLVTQQYTRGLGSTVSSLRALLDQSRPPVGEVVEKIAFGCCDEPEFMKRLQALDRKTVVLAGIETHVCVLQTALGLVERGYRTVVVADCVSSRKVQDREVALRRMEAEGALLTTYESLLFELTRVAGTETFKAISRLVK